MIPRVTVDFTRACMDLFGDNFVGVYLHGSAAMACFNPECSDVDLIAVVKRAPSDEVKRRLMEETVALNERAPKRGIEMSVVRAEVCDKFVYPTPFELHWSIAHADRWRERPDDYIRDMNGTDRDLAAHFTVIRARGLRIWGASIKDVFGEVGREYYLDSILRDIGGAEEEITRDPMYYTLNLCRVLAYVEEGRVLSKKEGGEWMLEHDTAEAGRIVNAALKCYRKNIPMRIEAAELRTFAGEMLERIKTAAR